MSTTAPWIRLATDWVDSEMFEGATHGARLAWICLLCHTKSHGRAGKAPWRKNAFMKRYELSERCIMEMLSRAQKCAAAECHGDTISVCNWADYQHHRPQKRGERAEIPQSSPTHHPSPITHHPSPTTTSVGGKPPPRTKARLDEISDALIDLFGLVLGTDTQKKNLGRWRRDIYDTIIAEESHPEGSWGDVVQSRYKRYQNQHPTWELTPNALVKYFDQLRYRRQPT